MWVIESVAERIQLERLRRENELLCQERTLQDNTTVFFETGGMAMERLFQE